MLASLIVTTTVWLWSASTFLPPGAAAQSGRCSFSVRYRSDSVWPLLMRTAAYRTARSSTQVTMRTPSFMYPRKESRSRRADRVMVLEDEEDLTLLCPGQGNVLTLTETGSGLLKCDNGDLVLDDWDVSWADCTCLKRPQSMERRTAVSCGGKPQAKLHLIGWKLANQVFVPQLTICFDHQQETTLYVIHKINGRALYSKFSDRNRPRFKKGYVFKSRVYRWYLRSEQKKSVNERFRIGNAGSEDFLSRGHLSPDADFALLAEQDATYYYSNVVPQWQPINNGNWRKLEEAVRNLAAARGGRTLMIYTGTLLGPLEATDSRGTKRPVFLDAQEERIPVPAVLWKVVHNPASNKAAVVLQINSLTMQLDIIRQLSQMARSVCGLIPWVDWDTSDPATGYTICWRAEDFARILLDAPPVTSFELFTE